MYHRQCHNHYNYHHNLHFNYIIGSFQVKVLVPNSTAGMIIGKGGAHVKFIKEESGAYVQISQVCNIFCNTY